MTLWIILGIVFWAIGAVILYVIAARSSYFIDECGSTYSSKEWDDDDRFAIFIVCFFDSWCAVIGLGLRSLIVNKFTIKFAIKFLKILEPKK